MGDSGGRKWSEEVRMGSSDVERLTEFSKIRTEEEEGAGGGVYNFFGRLFRKSPDPETVSTAWSMLSDHPEAIILIPQFSASIDAASSGAGAGGSRGVEEGGGLVRPGSSHNLIRQVSKTRSLSNVTQRLSSVLSGVVGGGGEEGRTVDPVTGQLLMDYNRSDFRQYWMPDYRGRECYECQEKFTTLRRRHHCRICGQIFCARCCNREIPGRFLGYMGNLRLCNWCCNQVTEFLDKKTGEGNSMNNPSTQNVSSLAGLSSSSSLQTPTCGPNVSIDPSSPVTSPLGGISVISYGRGGWPAVGSSSAALHLDSTSGLTGGSNSKASMGPSTLCVTDLPVGSSALDLLSVGESIQGAEDATPGRYSAFEEFEPEWVKSIEEETRSGSRLTPADELETGTLGSGSFQKRPRSLDRSDDREKNRIGSSNSEARKTAQPIDIGKEKEPEEVARSVPLFPLLDATDTVPQLEKKSEHGSVCSAVSSDNLHSTLEQRFDNQIIALLKYLLNWEKVSLDWLEVLWPLVRKISYTVQPNVRENKDHMDILNYVHIKKLSSSTVRTARMVSGTVCTKTIADTRMRSEIENPQILLLGGSVEYERVGGKLSSLDPIILQEFEYLKNVVHKIASRKPNLVIVEKTVARIAQRIMRREGLTLVYNVKPAVVKRIARCCEADITYSVEGTFVKPRMGSCGNFRTESHQLLNGKKQSLLIFENCQPNLGCSILLSGPDSTELRRIKRVVKFIVSNIYSTKLEKSMLETMKVCLTTDTSESRSNSNEVACGLCSANAQFMPKNNLEMTGSVSEDNGNEEEMSLENALCQTTLTASPFLSFALPYFETKEGKDCSHSLYFKRKIFPFRKPFSNNVFLPLFTNDVHVTLLDPLGNDDTIDTDMELQHPFRSLHIKDAANTIKCREDLANYRAFSGQNFRARIAERKQHLVSISQTPTSPPLSPNKDPSGRNRHISGPNDVLSPYGHWRIAVLFSSYSPKSENAPGFCIDPWVVWMEFYGRHDMALGDFLHRYCFNKSYMCPKREGKHCEVTMLDHVRKLVHRNACVEISCQSIMEENDPAAKPSTGESETLMWDWCGKCRGTTPASTVGKEVFNLSFAKYLEYLFNGLPLSTHINGSGEDSVCSDCPFHQHDHYFSFHNFVASFKVRKVKLYEVSFNPMVCCMLPVSVPVQDLVEESKAVSEVAGTVFSSMLEQTCKLQNHQDAGKYSHLIKDLIMVNEQGQDAFRDRINTVQSKLTDPSLSPVSTRKIQSTETVHIGLSDGLTASRQILCAVVMNWNKAVADFQNSVKKKHPLLHSASTADLERVKTTLPTLEQLGVEELHSTVPSISAMVTEQQSSAGSSRRPSAELGEENQTNELANHLENTMHPSFSTTALLAPTPTETRKPQHSKSTIPLSIWTLQFPFPLSDHYTLPVGRIPVVVRDGEIGSIVSYGLSSMEYEQKRKSLRDVSVKSGLALNLKSMDASEHHNSDQNPVDQHIELQFSDATSIYYCKVYYAEEFRLLRKLLFNEGEDAFVRCLSRSEGWAPKGGKSGACFFRTQDKRFIMKTLSRFEISSFLKFAPNYFQHISTAATENKLTALCKLYGVYRVCYKNDITKEAWKKDIFVMEYLFYGRSVSQVYDLKGSLRNRMASSETRRVGEPDCVELDENMLKKAWFSPNYLHPHSKTVLTMAIQQDSHFLSSHHVMDYSLLVGVDEEKGELMVGIIDYIRTYTLDKKLEYWVKSVAVPGQLPTIISPEMYKTRFTEAIDIYFPVSPDQWAGLGQGMLN